MTRVIAIANQKSGAGKTTTAVNLSAYLASLDKRTLLVDLDPQANASRLLGNKPSPHCVYEGLLGQATAGELIESSAIPNLDFIPAAPRLAGLLTEFAGKDQAENSLRKFLKTIRGKYEYIIIDLAPTLSLLAMNGLLAADELIVPVNPEHYDSAGLSVLLKKIADLKEKFGHDIKVTGALITMYNRKERLSRDTAKDLKKNFPHYIFNVGIPPLAVGAEIKKGSLEDLAYRRLTEDIISREL